MNAPPFNDFKAVNGSELSDERMDQVRELLIGDAVRRLELRLAHLEARLSNIEGGLARRVDGVEAKVDSMSGAAEGDRRAMFAALAQAVGDLGEQIRRISRG